MGLAIILAETLYFLRVHNAPQSAPRTNPSIPERRTAFDAQALRLTALADILFQPLLLLPKHME